MSSCMEGVVAVSRHLLGGDVAQTVRRIQDNGETAKPHLSRKGRYGFVLYSDGMVFFPHVRC